MQLRADKKNWEKATQRNGTQKAVIKSEELIAKEACYHTSSLRKKYPYLKLFWCECGKRGPE